MAVVEKEMNGNRDRFPIGMRVLAVDDDPLCLKLLSALLVRCQYDVTTTNQAVVALKMLRENRDQFDLVISDVHMPDMDGFKLLELVGLEMDLPVIMLSANGETQAVMKGITHGAVDYLLKPVRIEELKNIWQHVIRRKRFDPKDPNNAESGDDCEKAQLANFEGGQGSSPNASSDRNGKFNKKRKEQDEEDDDDDDNEEENDPDCEDPSAQKKPRVVWSVELHQKFVAAVKQLGIDKAVPKRILDLMNVERLTRENVASHLQKYRLYLKRLSAAANQQANMVAAFRGRDPSSYLPMGSLDGYAHFNALVGSRPIPPRSSFQPNVSLSKINNLNGFGLHGFVPSGSAQLGRTLNTSTPISDLGKHQGIALPNLRGSHRGTLLQGMPTSLDLDKLQQPKMMQEASCLLLGGFSGSGVPIGNSNDSFATQQQSSVGIRSSSSDPFEIGVGDSSHFADLGRCNESWNNVTSMVSQLGSSGPDAASSTVVMAPLAHPGIQSDALGIQKHASSLLMRANMNGDGELLNYGGSGSSKLNWQEANQAHFQNSNHIYDSLPNSSLPNIGANDRSFRNQILENGLSSKRMDMSMKGQTSVGAPLVAEDAKIVRTDVVDRFSHKNESFLEDMKSHCGYGSNGCGLDDLVNSMIKPERDDFNCVDGNMGCEDIFSMGACMSNSLF